MRNRIKNARSDDLCSLRIRGLFLPTSYTFVMFPASKGWKGNKDEKSKVKKKNVNQLKNVWKEIYQDGKSRFL